MSKTEKKNKKVRVHKCKLRDASTDVWRTVCGLKLDKSARATVTLADEWRHVTCAECKRSK
jgi:hypothetical protein